MDRNYKTKPDTLCTSYIKDLIGTKKILNTKQLTLFGTWPLSVLQLCAEMWILVYSWNS